MCQPFQSTLFAASFVFDDQWHLFILRSPPSTCRPADCSTCGVFASCNACFEMNFYFDCHETVPACASLWKNPQANCMLQRQVLLNPDTPTLKESPSVAMNVSHHMHQEEGMISLLSFFQQEICLVPMCFLPAFQLNQDVFAFQSFSAFFLSHWNNWWSPPVLWWMTSNPEMNRKMNALPWEGWEERLQECWHSDKYTDRRTDLPKSAREVGRGLTTSATARVCATCPYRTQLPELVTNLTSGEFQNWRLETVEGKTRRWCIKGMGEKQKLFLKQEFKHFLPHFLNAATKNFAIKSK